LLKALGAGAAAVVGTGLVVAGEHVSGGTPVAEAADGDFLKLGNLNTASSVTTLTPVAAATPDVLLSIDNHTSNQTALTTSALTGIGPSGTQGLIGQADGTTGAGVVGKSIDGFGVVGSSSSGVDLFAGLSGRLQQALLGHIGPPTATDGTYTQGEQIRDNAGDLFICTATGTPGSWKKMAAAQPGFAGGAISLLPAPVRLLDSRNGTGGAPHPLPANAAFALQVTGHGGIPAGAAAVVGNVTVVNPQGPGDLILYPDGVATPNVSSINYTTGQIVANGVIVALSAAGKMDIFVHAPTPADVIFDASGFII